MRSLLLLFLLSSQEPAIQAAREVWRQVETQATTLRSATLTLGGGQQPTTWTLLYEGGVEADFERDPYAEPFRLRRANATQTLPAVGPGELTFWYDSRGDVAFSLVSGPDITGLVQGLAPDDELRVWYKAGRAVAAQWDHAREKGARVDDPGSSTPLGAAARALGAHAAEVHQAIKVLAR